MQNGMVKMPTLEERVSALEATVRNNELAERETHNVVRREISDLGGLTAKSFPGVHHQMDRMETRTNLMDLRMERMEANMDTRFTSLEADMSAVLEILNQKFGG
jgi:hypothetical protein